MKNFVLIFISITTFISCSDSDDKNLQFDRNSYQKHKDLWVKSKLLNYQFTYMYFSGSTGGSPKMTNIIKDGKFNKSKLEIGNKKKQDYRNMNTYKTIDDLFDFIDRIAKSSKKSIALKNSHMKGAKIEVEYDKTYHYPIKISCIGHYPQGFVGGLSTHIRVIDFKLIKQ